MGHNVGGGVTSLLNKNLFYFKKKLNFIISEFGFEASQTPVRSPLFSC